MSEPTAAQPTITVNNTGLKPWTGDNYDLSLETYQIKGGSGSIGIFRKDIKDFFERNLAGSRPPRLCRKYIRQQACEIFHDPAIAPEQRREMAVKGRENRRRRLQLPRQPRRP